MTVALVVLPPCTSSVVMWHWLRLLFLSGKRHIWLGERDPHSRVWAPSDQDAGIHKQDFGLVSVSVLERRDGTDPGRPPILGKNHICKRDRCKSLDASLAAATFRAKEMTAPTREHNATMSGSQLKVHYNIILDSMHNANAL